MSERAVGGLVKPITAWTKADFRALPYERDWHGHVGPFETITCVARSPDHVQIRNKDFLAKLIIKDLSFDALPTSGAIRFWLKDAKLMVGPDLSSLEIYPALETGVSQCQLTK